MNDNVQFLTDEITRLQNMLMKMELNQSLMSVDLKYLRKSEDRNFERINNKINRIEKSLIEIKELIRHKR
ncbi:hypothetical protein ACY2DA_02420 [Staphylococcus simulans]